MKRVKHKISRFSFLYGAEQHERVSQAILLAWKAASAIKAAEEAAGNVQL